MPEFRPPRADQGFSPHRRRLLISAASAFTFAAGGAHAEGFSGGLDLSPYRGRVVYLDFWASWCGPCKLSFPYIAELNNTFKSRGLAVLAINVDHSRPLAEVFLDRYGRSVQVVFDPKGAIATQFKVKAMPTSIVVGKDGRVRHVHEGFYANKMPEYRSHIMELLDENS